MPRILDPDKLIGAVAICNTGRIGVIDKYIQTKNGFVWKGKGLYDRGEWSSKNPFPIAWTLDDYNESKYKWTENINILQENKGKI